MENENMLTETRKKSDLNAKDMYDFQKMQAAGEHFLSMQWEAGENIIFRYDIRRLTSFTEVRKEDFIIILNLLMRVAEFEPDSRKYMFSLEPENLYYNSNGYVGIKRRDIIPYGNQEADFIIAYKALIACALTGQYTYLDYMEGGGDLLNKNAVTAPIAEISEVTGLVDYLEALKGREMEQNRNHKVMVGKRRYLVMQSMLGLLLIGVILLGCYGGIQYFKVVPYLTAVNAADNAYIESDDLAIIAALRDIEISELDKHQKYILARAYLQMESLSTEQKNNILSRLTLSANEKQLEYWIYLGRLQVAEAEDVSMQLSDNELLLYAYLKEKALIETDSSLTGSEKEQSLGEIQTKINNLAEQYHLIEE